MKIIDENGMARECIDINLDPAFAGYIKADFESKVRKGYKHSEWFPVDEFIKNNPKLKNIIGKVHDSTEDIGVVSKATTDSIQDISKKWKKDIFNGVTVWISRGKGEGEQRKIINNNKNTFYVDEPWTEIPDRTSQYVISNNVAKDIKAVGNTLPGIETKSVVEKLIKKAKMN
ncbi:hypothetical protein BH10PAT1_BH10PAT1_1030 [soil metagenome]